MNDKKDMNLEETINDLQEYAFKKGISNLIELFDIGVSNLISISNLDKTKARRILNEITDECRFLNK